MKLILTQEVSGLGAPGDIVEVKDGYGRNFLIPRGFAIRWTAGGERQIDSIKSARNARAVARPRQGEGDQGQARGRAGRVPVRAGEGGRLFGAVTVADIADGDQQACGRPALGRRRQAQDHGRQPDQVARRAPGHRQGARRARGHRPPATSSPPEPATGHVRPLVTVARLAASRADRSGSAAEALQRRLERPARPAHEVVDRHRGDRLHPGDVAQHRDPAELRGDQLELRGGVVDPAGRSSGVKTVRLSSATSSRPPTALSALERRVRIIRSRVRGFSHSSKNRRAMRSPVVAPPRCAAGAASGRRSHRVRRPPRLRRRRALPGCARGRARRGGCPAVTPCRPSWGRRGGSDSGHAPPGPPSPVSRVRVSRSGRASAPRREAHPLDGHVLALGEHLDGQPARGAVPTIRAGGSGACVPGARRGSSDPARASLASPRPGRIRGSGWRPGRPPGRTSGFMCTVAPRFRVTAYDSWK